MASKSMYQGETTVITITMINGTEVSLTATDLSFRMERHGKKILQHDLASANVAINSVTEFEVTLDPADTATLDPGVYNLMARHIDSQGAPTIVSFTPDTLIIKKSLGFS